MSAFGVCVRSLFVGLRFLDLPLTPPNICVRVWGLTVWDMCTEHLLWARPGRKTPEGPFILIPPHPLPPLFSKLEADSLNNLGKSMQLISSRDKVLTRNRGPSARFDFSRTLGLVLQRLNAIHCLVLSNSFLTSSPFDFMYFGDMLSSP